MERRRGARALHGPSSWRQEEKRSSAYANTGQQEAGDRVLFPVGGKQSARGFSVASRSRRMMMTSVHYLVADDGQELPVLVVGLRGGHGDGARRRRREAKRPASFRGKEAGREVCRTANPVAVYKGKMHLCSRLVGKSRRS